jgi:TetR/AcrR family transcriptional regulator, transcriptional repressor for nem operon
MIAAIADQMGDVSPSEAKKAAIVGVATMVGAMTLARIVTDAKLSDSILAAARLLSDRSRKRP